MDTMPVVYLSHGAPPLADDPVWPQQLADWSATLPNPKAILMVSAHWEDAPIAVGATRTVPLVYDFWGFPRRYYEVSYPAPGAPDLATSVRQLLGEVRSFDDRGLDHGAYVPLVEMYPDADIPVLQLSMPSLDPQQLFDLGQKLAPLRNAGVLIIGSGFFTHNLMALDPGDGTGSPDQAPSWSREFDQWGRDILAAGDIDAMLDFAHKAPAAHMAHPRTEHLAPLFVTLGAGAHDLSQQRQAIDGYWFGLSKRSIQIG